MNGFRFDKTRKIIASVVAVVVIIIVCITIFVSQKNKTSDSKNDTQTTQSNNQNTENSELKFEQLRLQDLRDLATCKSYSIKRGDVLNCNLEFKRNLIFSDISAIRFQLVSAVDTVAPSQIKPLDFTCTSTNIATTLSCNVDTSVIKSGQYATYITINGESQFGISENIRVN